MTPEWPRSRAPDLLVHVLTIPYRYSCTAVQYRTTEYHPPTTAPPCARAARGAPRFRADLTATHPPCIHDSQIGHIKSSEPHPLGKIHNPAARSELLLRTCRWLAQQQTDPSGHCRRRAGCCFPTAVPGNGNIRHMLYCDGAVDARAVTWRWATNHSHWLVPL